MLSVMKKGFICSIAAGCCIASLGAFDNAHFYKPPSWYGSVPASWFGYKKEISDHSWLTHFDASVSYANTRSMWDDHGKKTGILNPAGLTDLLGILDNVQPALPVTNQFFRHSAILAPGRGRGDFGLVDFSGKFTLMSVDVALRQNLISGVFVELGLPIRQVKMQQIELIDHSPKTGNGVYNQNNISWRAMKGLLNQTLDYYGYKSLETAFNKTTVGDTSVMIGWEQRWHRSHGSFFGLTLKGGMSVPNRQEKEVDRVFSLPVGYNNHLGLSGYAQSDFAFCKHLAFCIHGGLTHFFDGSTRTVRIKTDVRQQGYVTLAQAKVHEGLGVLFHGGGHMSIDHFLGGMSARVGYSYTQQDGTTYAFDDKTLNAAIAQDNILLKRWYYHTLHAMLDYDTSVHARYATTALRISAFANIPLDGKNVYKSYVYGGSFGLQMRWAF